jgi:hypothetical protein
MSGLKAVVALVLEAGRIRERLLADQARQISQAAGVLLEAARAQRTLHVCGDGALAPLGEFLAARFRGDGDSLLVPARSLPQDLDARQLLAFAHSEETILVLSLDGASRLSPLLRQAKSQGVVVIGILGRDAAPLTSYCDTTILLPPAELCVLAEVVLSVGHVLCALVGQGLGQLRPVPHVDESVERPVISRDPQEYSDLALQPDSDEGDILSREIESGYAPPTNPRGTASRGTAPRPDPELSPEVPVDDRFRFRCGGCEAVISVDPRHCGRRGKCPHCTSEFTIPGDAPSEPSSGSRRPLSSESTDRPSTKERPRTKERPGAKERPGTKERPGSGRRRGKTRRRRRSTTSSERRRAPRVTVQDALVRLSYEGYPDQRQEYHEPHSLDDLSLTGLRFLGPSRRYEVGKVVYLSLDFPAFPLPVRIKGEIRRVVRLSDEEGYGTGVRFLEYVGDAESQIRRLLEADNLRAVRRR